MSQIGNALLDLVSPRRSPTAPGEARASSSEMSLAANPTGWLREFLGGGENDAGVMVNEKNAEGISAVWRSVNNIAEDTAKLPIELIRKDDSGRREIIHDDPALDRLNRQANPFVTAYAMRETLMRHAAGWGNGYAEIVRNRAGQPVEVWNLPPWSVKPEMEKAGTGWKLVYRYTSPVTGQTTDLEPANILHVRGPGDSIVGFSPVRLFRTSLGLTMSAESTGAKLFGRGLRPSGAIKHPKNLSEGAARNLRESIEKKYGGMENAFRVMVLEEGMEFVASTIPPEDAQFLETRNFQIDEICRIWRMPPHKVQNLARSTNNNIEHQGIEYKTDTLGAWFKRAESEYDRKLLGPNRQGACLEHNDNDLSRGDQKSRAEAAQIWLNAGVKTPDEIRDDESMNPLANGVGGQTLVPSTMITREALAKRDERAGEQPLPNAPKGPTAADPAADPAEDPAEPPEPAPAPAKRSSPEQLRAIAAAMAPAIETVMVRMVRIEADRCSQASKTKAPAAWAEVFYHDHELVVRSELMGLAEVMVHAIKITDSGAITVSVNELGRRAAAKVCSEARAAISATGNVDAALEGWRTNRPAADARSIVQVWTEALVPV